MGENLFSLRDEAEQQLHKESCEIVISRLKVLMRRRDSLKDQLDRVNKEIAEFDEEKEIKYARSKADGARH